MFHRKISELKGSSLWLGALGILFILLTGLFAPWIAPHDPLAVDTSNRLSSPGLTYPFGTDHLGRCVLSRIIYGIRVTVISAFCILLITAAISIPIALISGYIRGNTDHIIMRMIDGMLAIPDFVLTIAIVGMLGPSFINMIIAIVMVRWADYVRFIRSLVIKERQEDYILYARMTGNSHIRILSRYILPQILSRVLVFAALDLGRIVLLIAGLSFLGVGVQPPTPEWGVMLQDATGYFQVAPHVMIFPGMVVVMFVLACQLISDRFNEPVMKEG
ncbi:nickel transporter permease [Alteribacillus bidgolensis]|uniref:ABC-type dipeptide/oligopeptide/nickel transport system, permease component n=1 Tax=Alteribacillus bidgolensis TaxID=930129 RepID=A0A1G8ENE1_9BACI|nr:nickel transporter permease [Alteribacillus bidgolensis]SDH71209.1 ABC-type dipeptide/oligopeptide/nickel transport system, permease component [Alteribacillus bidgolensis]